MTRARKASVGLASPPPLQHWLHAVLMLCVSLVHHAATTLRMWLRAGQRDWHTQSEVSAPPQATSGTSSQGPNTPTESCLGLSQASLLDQRGDSRSIPTKPSTRMLATRASMTPLMLLRPEQPFLCHSGRTPFVKLRVNACEPEPRGVRLRLRRARLLGSRSRSRASGMTLLLC
jgi:hypothetical protein